ncbi:MAG: magnesium-translocating P-type ATPase [Polyangiales bacterium]
MHRATRRVPGSDHAAVGLRAEETLAELLTRLASTSAGLTSTVAAARLQASGPNEPRVARLRSRLIELLRVGLGPLGVILLVASLASALLGQALNAAIIAAIVLLGAALDFWQTARSERVVHSLQTQVAPTATVLRDGAFRELHRAELVAGDIIRLGAGDLVPADARLCESHDLHVHQAALTGESLPAEKSAIASKLPTLGPDCAGLVFLGTSIVSGTAIAVVFATGKDTAFGDIVTELAARPEETEFERGMRHFGMLIVQTVFFLVLFIVVVSVASKRDAFQSLLFAVALAVGLTPEFLPMITSVTLAEGALRMARAKVIVKHLSAIQNLGAIDVLCSDKTGTLTAGTMSLDKALDLHGDEAPRVLELGRLNSRFQTGIKSPLDAAILAHDETASPGYAKTDEIPFDFERRRTSVVLQKEGAYLFITKGAPEGILPACASYELGGQPRPLDAQARASCDETYRALSTAGLRVLACAYRSVDKPSGFSPQDERELTLVGFLTFSDHLLEGVAESIAALRNDGVEVKIISGDNELVCAHVCAEAGLDASRIVLGSEIEHMLDGALAHTVEQASVFARVSPAQKHRIVRALKSQGHVVGFMGDGINDAPSLHGADVGISVAGAVDVAKEASDIILLEQRLDVLHGGIMAGRKAFGNVLKYLLMGTSSNFGNMFSMAGAALILPFLPMLPTQILLNNFLYDLAQITIPTDNVDPSYTRGPQRWDVRLIRNFMLVVGPLSSLYDFLTFYVLIAVFHFGEKLFHTGWFVESLLSQTLVLFVIRTAGRPWQNRPSLALTLTTLAVAVAAVVLPYLPFASALGLAPLPARYLGFLLVAVTTYLALVELVKRRVMGRILRPALASAPPAGSR